MLVASQFITDPSGNILVTKTYDHEEHAQGVRDIKDSTKGWTKDRTMRLSFSIPPSEYVHWQETVGQGCWEDPDFLKFYRANSPQYCL